MKNFCSILLCLCLSFFLSGCWDAVELQQRAIVLMIGIDRIQHDSHGIRVSLQLARPQNLSTPPNPSSESGEKSTVVVSQNGIDVNDAIRKIQLATDRRLFFEHARALVINEEVAKHGTLPIIDSMMQARTAPRDAWLFVSSIPAKEVLQYKPALDAIPSTYFTNFFGNQLLLKRSYDATLGGFHQRLVTPGIQPFAIWIGAGAKELSAPELRGIAAFSGDHFVDGFNQEQTLGWQLLENQFPNSPLTFTCRDRSDGKFVVNVKSAHSTVHVYRAKGSAPVAVISVRIKGWLGNGTCLKQADPTDLKLYKQKVEKQITTVLNTTIRHSKILNADILGIGQSMYRYEPRSWYGDTEWNKGFHQVIPQIHVDAQLEFLQTYKKLGST